MQPHRHRYWLNANPENPVEFRQQVIYICQLHKKAKELLTQGIHLVSTDEMSGIQALERAHATRLMKPRRLEQIEFEYIRHGRSFPDCQLARSNGSANYSYDWCDED